MNFFQMLCAVVLFFVIFIAAIFAVAGAAFIAAPVALTRAPRIVEISAPLGRPTGPIEGIRGRLTEETGFAKERADG
jgi:hypothetical protein